MPPQDRLEHPGFDGDYDRVGEGPPLVFVHGAAEDGRAWQPQLAPRWLTPNTPN
ncbi:MAG: alpha/beta fold hydrolase [Solirubrobacteraceae bacterium]